MIVYRSNQTHVYVYTHTHADVTYICTEYTGCTLHIQRERERQKGREGEMDDM